VRIHYYLEIDENKKIKCRKCGKVICDASENYKAYVPRAEIWPDELPGIHPAKNDALAVYYEYYCPGCFTLLDVEVAEEGAPPLWDIQVDL
jgi:acetone carboxylase gamma subunit